MADPLSLLRHSYEAQQAHGPEDDQGGQHVVAELSGITASPAARAPSPGRCEEELHIHRLLGPEYAVSVECHDSKNVVGVAFMVVSFRLPDCVLRLTDALHGLNKAHSA